MTLICKKIVVIDKMKPLIYGKRCIICGKRIPISQIYKCRCGIENLCTTHRIPEEHLCAYNFARKNSNIPAVIVAKKVEII